MSSLQILQEVVPGWRKILRNNFTSLEKLADFLELSSDQRAALDWKSDFVLNLPLRIAEKMAKTDLNDPLVRQFLPLLKEREVPVGFSLDPVQDCSFQLESKLLQKYQGRVLLLCTSACAMHCRYCFRRHFPYEKKERGFEKEVELIRQDASIHEVILSGGDPLSLSDTSLALLLDALYSIPHVERIRFHTRFPLGIPERIDASFLELVQRSRKQLIFVIHTNHPREWDPVIFEHLRHLQKAGCLLLNQSVLLKGVNDSVAVLRELSELLVNHGILPYYLHQLDRTLGAAHFEVEEEKGLALIAEMTQQLSGFAVPKYVKEVAGGKHKEQVLHLLDSIHSEEP